MAINRTRGIKGTIRETLLFIMLFIVGNLTVKATLRTAGATG
jgi:hypothetical protein